MEVGKVKSAELICAGLVIIIFVVLGAWIAYMSPATKKKPKVIQQQAVSQVVDPTNEESEMRVIETPTFIPIGESSIAVKFSEAYEIEKPEENVLLAKKQGKEYLISIYTLADTVKQEQSCKSADDCDILSLWTVEDFQELQDAYQKGEEEEEFTLSIHRNRYFYYRYEEDYLEQGGRHVFRTFFGDTWMMEISITDENNNQQVLEQLIDVIEEIQFTSRFLSRYGMQQVLIKLFAKEKLVSAENIVIENLWMRENHVRGEVLFTTFEESEAGIFFATRADNRWRVVFDGNGVFACDDLQQNAFPQEMQDGCTE